MPDLARLTRVGAVLCAATLPMALLVSAPAHAMSPAAPSGLAPRGTVATATPTFSWHRVASATRYLVQADDDPSFSSPNLNVTTTNTRAVPTANLPQGQVFWRVRTVSTAGQSPWVGEQVDISPTNAAPPSGLAPSTGTVLAQPNDPPLLSWNPVPGAVGYDVEVDAGDPADFIGAALLSSPSTSVLVPKPQPPGTWSWHVRAQLGGGLVTGWSEAATYVVQELGPVQISPTMETGRPIQDVVLDWLPVDGAVKYELQVGLDQDFNNIIDTQTVSRTRYSPTVTYDNDTYFWRVRAIDATGNKMAWPSAPFSFQRDWPQRPTLVHPADQLQPTGDDFYYQWTPVAHAQGYQLQVGSDPNFSPGTFKSCQTAQTTYTMGYAGSLSSNGASLQSDPCAPTPGHVTHWRVRALDGPHNPFVEGIWSEAHQFVYDSSSYSTGPVQPLLPANGDTVDVPTLTWTDDTAKKQALSYHVEIKDVNGAITKVDTLSPRWTPPTLNPAKGPFTWTVQAHYADGTISPVYDGWTFDVSGAAPDYGVADLTPVTGVQGDPATARFPVLSWQPEVGAKTYKIQIGVHGSTFWDSSATPTITRTAFAYPAATDTTDYFFRPGQYDWRVQAFSSTGALIDSGPVATFTIDVLDAVTGQRIALDGNAVEAHQSCDNALGSSDPSATLCTQVPATPVLKWDPVPGAAYYAVYLANDREMTNRVFGNAQPIPVTSSTIWTLNAGHPLDLLADNQSSGAYYWFIRPCSSKGQCGPDPISQHASATNAFRKISPQPVLHDPSTVPGNTCTVQVGIPVCSDDIAFAWDDYLTTNADAEFDLADATSSTYGDFTAYGGQGQYWPTTVPNGNNPSDSPSSQEAETYRIQISATDQTQASGAFISPLDTFTVDQATFTDYARTLPEGDLYWHVQARDAQGNYLTWSPIGHVRKSSGVVSLTSPKSPTTKVDGGTPFRWQPQDGAQTYTIEVYQNDDSAHSLANRVFTASTYQPAYVWSKYLPPSDKPYLWRVQWTDAFSVKGDWSADGHFLVGRATVLQASPSAGGYQPAAGPYLTWNQAHSAAQSGGQPTAWKYRVEVRRADGGTVMNVTTTALAAAATTTFNDGSYEWQVTAYDQSGGVLGTSVWRTFKVDSSRPTVVRATPTSGTTSKRTANFVATFSEPVRNVSSSTVKLYVKGHTGAIPATVSLSRSKLKATLNPTKNLVPGKKYSVKVTSGIKDLSGLRLVAYTWVVTAK